METEVMDILTYTVPFLVAYNVWLHNMVIKAQTQLAIYAERNGEISKNIEELKGSIRDLNEDIKEMKKELHEFMMKK